MVTKDFTQSPIYNYKYAVGARSVLSDFSKRVGKKGQFLNWVDLPKEQLKVKNNGLSHVDEIYQQAEQLKKQSGDYPLVVLGIGGSKHTVETILNLAGAGNKGKVYFYSDIDYISEDNFKKEIGNDLSKANYLVVSKSGTTFETKDAFMRFQNGVKTQIQETPEEKELESQKHFAIVTDMTPSAKNLRGVIGSKNGKDNNYIKELYIHDDVDSNKSAIDAETIGEYMQAKHFETIYKGMMRRKSVREG